MAGDAPLSVGLFRDLLAEQMGTLLEGQRLALEASTRDQRAALADAVEEIKAEHSRALEGVQLQLDDQAREIQRVRRDRDAVLQRLEALESGKTANAAKADGVDTDALQERAKRTLVTGGWANPRPWTSSASRSTWTRLPSPLVLGGVLRSCPSRRGGTSPSTR